MMIGYWGMLGENNMMGQYGMMTPGLMGLLMMAFFLLAVVGAVLLLVWIVRQLSGPEHRQGISSGIGSLNNPTNNTGQEAPLAILQRRYARGEIGPDEYECIRSDLLRDGG